MSGEKAEGLPVGWAIISLADIVIDLQSGFACGAHNRGGTGVPHLRPMNVNEHGRIQLEDLKFVAKEEADRDERWLRKGDVLFNNTNSPELVGKTAFYDLDEPRAFSNHMTRIRFREGVSAQFYALFLHQQWREQYFEGICNNHVSQASVSRSTVSALQVPLPPTPEQFRIVAAVERVLEKLSAARERLERVPTTLKRFRQAVLASACSGRLTADWRARNPSVNDVGVILRSLGLKPLYDGAPDEEIPEGWRWVRFGDVLGELRNGLSTKPNQIPPGTPILRINAVRPCEVSFNDLRYLECSDAQRREYALRDGDLLFTRYNGSLELLGVCGMVRGVNGRAFVYPDKLMRVRFSLSMVLAGYCEQFFSSPAARDRMIAKAKSSAGQNGVSGSDVKAQPFALPAIEEQREIVGRVSALLALADAIEQRAKSALRRVEMLTEAVHAKAFRGELVPTEAELARRESRSYEPASELLTRLKSSMNGGTKRARGRKSSKQGPASKGSMLEFMEG